MDENTTILTVKGLTKEFLLEKSFWKSVFRKDCAKITALNNVSFELRKGETLGILGESGSGKSTLARVLMGIYPPDGGSAKLWKKNLFTTNKRERLDLLRNMQMIFQDPYGSLDPRMTIRKILVEPLAIHKNIPKSEWEDLLTRLVQEVGLSVGCLDKYPSEFSGGQRQRIGICRALILNPEIIIADEAVSALDVSVQAQILNLLEELKKKRKLSMLFISHDIAVVKQLSDRILLMYKGHLVEEIEADKLLTDACHPYTEKLLRAALFLREGKIKEMGDKLPEVKGNFKEEGGCCFFAGCSRRSESCIEKPELFELNSNHRIACWNVKK